MPVCALCRGNVTKLVESHIYPRALNVQGMAPGATLAEISDKGVKRSRTGVYDAFLCHGCEQRFGPSDQAVIELARLVSSDQGRFIFDEARRPAAQLFSVEQVNSARIRQFAAALLFRAHCSKHAFFHEVDVGPHINRLAEIVQGASSASPDEFGAILFRPLGGLSLSGLAAQKIIFATVNGYWFGMPNLHVFVKVDRRPLPTKNRGLQLKDNAPVAVLHRKASREEMASVARLVSPHVARIDKLLGT